MNKIEANLSLLAITFLATVQYIFLAGVPDDLSNFAFLSITNLIGFFMALSFFFGELFRLDIIQLKQSAILSLELIGCHFFMMMGLQDIATAAASSILASYFVFVLIFEAVIHRKMPDKFSIISVITVLIGVFSLLNINILYILLADICMAIYIMNVGNYASSSNPSILVMGQMFFSCIFSFILWIGEIIFTDTQFSLPANKEFWVGVIYISFFVRWLYAIIQIYAQRYVSPLNTSLIFSSEIVITMIISPILSPLFNLEPEIITPFKIFGGIIITFGLLIMEPGFFVSIKNFFLKNAPSKVNNRKKFYIIVIIAIIYIVVDIPVVMTEFLPNYIGIKNALPFITGLFWWIYGVIGCCVGAVISSIFLAETINSILWECWCTIAIGLCMYFGWLYFSAIHRILFKKMNHYLIYIISAIIGSFLCLKPEYTLSYLAAGILIGLPVNILFGSILYIEPVLPSWCRLKYDAEFELDPGNESLLTANEILQRAAEANKIDSKRIFETQSCLEELSIRIFKAIPDAKIKVKVIYQEAISIWLEYIGAKYNPFIINKNDNIFDITSLKIIKHRALRASYFYVDGENKVHAII